MTGLARLCQELLSGVPGPDDLATAEDWMVLALAESAADAETPANLTAPWTAALPPAAETGAGRALTLRLLAPTLLLDGVWLARAASPTTGHETAACRLLALYARIMGLEDPPQSPPRRFRAALNLAGVYLPPLGSPKFFARAGTPEATLRLPLAALCLLHRPRRFGPELLGFTLAHIQREPAWWDALPAPDWRKEDRALAVAALDTWPRRDAVSSRMAAGWRLYRREFAALCELIGQQLAQELSAEDVAEALVRARRAEALGYHGQVRLEGRSLDDWLRDSGADARPLLRALRASGRVDPACPVASGMMRAMAFGGRMFGVFDADERQAFHHWIEAPERPAKVIPTAVHGEAAATVAPDRPKATPGPGHPRSTQPPALPGGSAPSGRSLYLALLRAESPADCPEALAFVDGQLTRTRRFRWLQRGPRRGFPYSPEAFASFVEDLHRREVDRYTPLSGKPAVSRSFCRYALLQLAPAILCDGAWLAGIGTAAEKLGDIGRHLLKTYADELGDGAAFRNHPNVYRRLLAAEGLDLPPFDTRGFAEDPRFLDAAFLIPVHLLAMGLWTERYFPELLGLNLAIELSGLGSGYLRVSDLMRWHGMDSTIIDLHLSIDNLASGHAARARDSILLYLDSLRREGPAVVESQWQRIWTGYLSLDRAALPLVARLALHYHGGRLPAWLGWPWRAEADAMVR